MREVRLTVPELLFVVGTRAMLAGGVALLIASRLSRDQRKFIGATLALIGAVSTIPAAMAVFGKESEPEPEPEPVAAKPPEVALPDAPPAKPKRLTRRVKLNTGEPQPKQE